MRFFLDFLRQKAPKAGTEVPAYYRRALTASVVVLAVYFPLCFLMFFWIGHLASWVPLGMMAACLVYLVAMRRVPPRLNLGAYAAITLVWAVWYVHSFGWGSGVQHFLIPILILVFFNIFEPPWLKLIYALLLVSCRMLLYAYSINHTAVYTLDRAASIALQNLNSVALYIIVADLCIQFSTNLQATERQLRIDNQELSREAGTDALTQLPNRRVLMDKLDMYLKTASKEPFSVAIADIDFFKKVNDTYGHYCGDYTLVQLAGLFRELSSESSYEVCRWGGEEFCFFLPGKNLDEAGNVMTTVCSAVRQMPLSFEGNDFSITITVGVAENDFHSPMEAILKEADEKLYMGKEAGRDKVVV